MVAEHSKSRATGRVTTSNRYFPDDQERKNTMIRTQMIFVLFPASTATFGGGVLAADR